jgi:anti-sigma factor RsiW
MHVESRSVHLNDEQLIETHFLAGDNAHLRACPGCRTRYEELARALEHLREDAVSEADAVFTPERLHDQRDRVLRRLERLGHPADVLRFPNRFGSHQSVHRLLGPARRWVAGAAVAGLVAGVFLGFAVDRRVGAPAADRRGVVAAGAVGTWQPATAQDEQMLSEIEDALTGPARRVPELRTLDAMTIQPDLQEASFVPR